MKRVLIVKTSALGDIVHSYPVISYLKHLFPEILIDWVVEKECASLVEAHPNIHQVFHVSTKEWRRAPFSSKSWQALKSFRTQLQQSHYDAIFDLQGNIKSGLIVSLARGSHKVGFGANSVAEWPNMLFTNKRFDPPKGQGIRQDYLSLVTAFTENTRTTASIEGELTLKLNDAQHSLLTSTAQQVAALKAPYIIVSPGSAWPNKQLPIPTLTHFLDQVHTHLNCAFIFLWGSQGEQEIAKQLHTKFADHSLIVDKMPLPVVQNLMKDASLIIAMDSLPLHLAGTSGKPTFSIFGPSSATKYKPSGDKHFAFQGSCPYGRSFEKRCPILRSCPTGACMRDIQAGELFKEFIEWHSTTS